MTLKQRLQEIWQRAPSPRFEMIDGLRAMSVLWMIAFHSLFTLGYFLGREEFLALYSHWLMTPFVQGHLGVDVFFTISGFLIAHILFTEQKYTGHIDVRAFYLRRVFRLLPVYVFVLAVFALLNPVNVHNVWANLLYVNNYFPVEEQFMVWTWSLAIEGQFYVVFPIVVLLLGRSPRTLVIVLAALFVGSFVIRYGVITSNAISLPAPLHEVVDQQTFFQIFDGIYDKTSTRYGGLVIGVIAAWLHIFTSTSSLLDRHPRTNIAMLLCGLVLVIAAIAINPFSSGPAVEKFGLAYLVSYRNAMSLGIAMVILCCLTENDNRSVIQRFLASPFWYPISQLSYSAYLIHVIVIYAGYQLLLPEPFTVVHLLTFLPASLIVTFVLSAVLFITIERPFLRRRKR